MRTLDCGCETNDSASTLISMCSLHAGHFAMRTTAERLERNKPKRDREPLREKLLEAIAPVVAASVLSKRSAPAKIDHECAECTVDIVDEIIKRLD